MLLCVFCNCCYFVRVVSVIVRVLIRSLMLGVVIVVMIDMVVVIVIMRSMVVVCGAIAWS